MRKLKIISAVVALCALFIASATTNSNAAESVKQLPWSLTLGGAGTTPLSSVQNSGFGVQLGISRKIDLFTTSELGVRQSVNYVSSRTSLTTEVFDDVRLVGLFKNRLELLVGPNVAYTYGHVSPSFTVGPEAQLRLGIKKDAFVFVRSNFDWTVVGNSVTRGDTVRHSVGVGLRW